jgi:hypothetical protein
MYAFMFVGSGGMTFKFERVFEFETGDEFTATSDIRDNDKLMFTSGDGYDGN